MEEDDFEEPDDRLTPEEIKAVTWLNSSAVHYMANIVLVGSLLQLGGLRWPVDLLDGWTWLLDAAHVAFAIAGIGLSATILDLHLRQRRS